MTMTTCLLGTCSKDIAHLAALPTSYTSTQIPFLNVPSAPYPHKWCFDTLVLSCHPNAVFRPNNASTNPSLGWKRGWEPRKPC
jgi:hypothetical protein